MKREVYESQKAFAGEKKPSMQRRCVDFDYTQRMKHFFLPHDGQEVFCCLRPVSLGVSSW